MTRQFNELRSRLSETSRARATDTATAILEEMARDKLRRARELSRLALAQQLHVQHASIAKLERRSDMYISMLRAHIEAMGGEFEVVARFPEGSVRISTFAALDR